MDKQRKNKMTKDTIPEGFSVPLAVFDLIPVIFFGLSAIRVGSLFHSTLFVIGAVICLVSGLVKVLWKLIAAVAKKNIWLMFVQMRIFMPIGFIVLITTLIVDRANLNGSAILAGLLSFPSCIFFAIGVIGMILMTVLAFKADSSNPKVNLTEQFIIPPHSYASLYD